jgi:drug/metabolite transporter (DMT)-like permease
MFTFFQAVAHLGVALGIILQYTHPAFIILFGWIAFGRGVGWAAWVAVACVVAGVVFIVGYHPAGHPDQLAGFAWGIASAIANAAYLILGSHVQKRFGSGPSLLYGFAVACLIAVLWSAAQGSPTLDIVLQSDGNRLAALAIGIFGTLGAFALMVLATRYISALEAGLASGLEAVFAGLIAAWWFAERLTGSQLLGAALVLGGVALSYVRGTEGEAPPPRAAGAARRGDALRPAQRRAHERFQMIHQGVGRRFGALRVAGDDRLKAGAMGVNDVA